MEWLAAIAVMKTIGLTLAVGSSTFAIIFYFQAIRDGTIDQSERRFMHTVYFVLRIGMAIVIPIELGLFIHSYALGIVDPLHIARLIALFGVVGNAVCMHKKIMPMRIGPAIAGGSWYTYFGFNVLPLEAAAIPLSLPVLMLGYVIFVFLFFLLLEVLRRIFIPVR